MAKDVAAYMDLYNKYQDDYGIDEILEGKVKPHIYARLLNASFDERLSVVNMVLSGLNVKFAGVHREKYITDGWFGFLKSYKSGDSEYVKLLAEREKLVEKNRLSGFYTRDEEEYEREILRLLRKNIVKSSANTYEGFEKQKKRLEDAEALAGESLEHAFDFMENAFGESNDGLMVIFVTELTMSPESSEYLAENECERYISYSSSMLIGSRKAQVLLELETGAVKENEHIGF